MTKNISSVHCCPRQHRASLSAFRLPYSCPHQLLVKWNFGLWCSHLGEEGRKGFDEIEKANCKGLAEDSFRALLWTYARS